MGFYQNACKPEGWGGKLMLNMMNKGHASMAKWGFSHIDIKEYKKALDIGCGGGVNIRKMLSENPDIYVSGVDYSDISVKKSQDVNQKAIKQGRCEVRKGNVLELPYNEGSFDLVTAFETVYFWQDIDKAFKGVYDALKTKGKFLICNETDGEIKAYEKWVDIIDGMKIYNSEQLEKALRSAGFSEIEIYRNEKNWLCVIAQK